VSDNPGVIAPPPLLALGAIAIGFGLDALWPTTLPWREERIVGGIALFLAAGVLAGWAFATFRNAGTNVPTRRPSTTVVSVGPYRFSRNPIYIAMAAAIVGVGIAAGSAWVIAMAVPFLIVIDRGVIAREERYLSGKFAADYGAYRGRVRRWI